MSWSGLGVPVNTGLPVKEAPCLMSIARANDIQLQHSTFKRPDLCMLPLEQHISSNVDKAYHNFYLSCSCTVPMLRPAGQATLHQKHINTNFEKGPCALNTKFAYSMSVNRKLLMCQLRLA